MKRLSNALLKALGRDGLSQREFAIRIGLAPSVVTKIVQGRRPSPLIINMLCNAWVDHPTKRSILEAHLRDEAERAGFRPKEFNQDVLEGEPEIEEAIEVLRSEMASSLEFKAVILSQAAYAKRNYEGKASAGEMVPVKTGAKQKKIEPLEAESSRDLR